MRPRRHLGEKRVDIGRPVRLRGDDRGRAGGANGDRVFQKPVLAVESLVARTQENMRKQAQQFVRAVAAEDLCRVEAKLRGDRFAERARGRHRDKLPDRAAEPGRPRPLSGDGPSGDLFDESLWTFATPPAALLPGT